MSTWFADDPLRLLFLAVLPPMTLTKECEEASNIRAREMKINPITSVRVRISYPYLGTHTLISIFTWSTGISSEGYSGKGFVQSIK
jgi:hypothetical protein